jgi:phosphopantothenoylcysteine decarboxylase/phosphopantothenate--cysteine ligase
MSVLRAKRILLGVSAGIAAYKVASLVRLFVKSGAEVKVVMTPSAKDFVTPLTLSTLSKNPVHSEFVDSDDENSLWTNHVELGLWADLMLIAPLTANTLSKLASGNADNLLVAVYLSAKCPVYVAPAMDLDMHEHGSTRDNLSLVEERSNKVIPSGFGELASGLVGPGRMAEPEEIVQFIEKDILQSLPLHGKKVMITAGPTHEAIDPVRFIGNHSSGKMGFALAEYAASLGAEVKLIAGPSYLSVLNSNISRVDVKSAEDMFNAVESVFDDSDYAIFSAAVADYTPENISDDKIKKSEKSLSIKLRKTKDILGTFGPVKSQSQMVIGFALETNNEVDYAKAKLKSKNADLIVLNSLRDKGAGFSGDSNKVTLISGSSMREFSLKPKTEVAEDIWLEILRLQDEA